MRNLLVVAALTSLATPGIAKPRAKPSKAELMAKIKKAVAPAIAKTQTKFKATCGCALAIEIDEASFGTDASRIDDDKAVTRFKHNLESLEESSIADACKTADDKKQTCAHFHRLVLADTDDMGGNCTYDDAKKAATCFSNQAQVEGVTVLKAIGMKWTGSEFQW
jgi:hypothetical protein